MHLNLWHFYLHVSWFVQLHGWFDITTGFAMKNYPNLTFHMLNSWCVSQFIMSFLSSCQLICTAAQLIWHHQWICLEKLHQFDLSFFKFPGVYLNLCQLYLHFSWFVQLHSWFELTTVMALKDYPNLTFHMLNSLVCISIYVNFTFMSADLYRCTANLNPPLDWLWKATPIWPFKC